MAQTIGEVQKLLGESSPRFETVAIECTAEYNTSAIERKRAMAEGDESRSVVRVKLDRSSPDFLESSAGPFLRHHWTVWWRFPNCWRDDIVWDTGHMAISVACGDNSCSFFSAINTLYTNKPALPSSRLFRPRLGARDIPYLPTVEERSQQMPLVRPTGLATGWSLTLRGDAHHLGRQVIHLRAARLEAAARFGFWPFIDKYDILVDSARGILLRCAAIVDEEEVAVLSVQKAEFDEPIPDAVFAFRPPRGARVVSLATKPVI